MVKILMRASFIALTLATLFACASVFAQQGGEATLLVEVKEGAPARPLKQACVTVIPKEGEILFGKTDSKGKIEFRHLPPGRYRVVVKTTYAQKKEVTVVSGANAVAFNMLWIDGTEQTGRGQQ
ncbi:MAG TPA: carboxypeptidase-like regulatory domain-containing protein [Pyrinomonadaceae bacterium]